MMGTSKLIFSVGILLTFMLMIQEASGQKQDVILEGKFRNWPKMRLLTLMYNDGATLMEDTIVAVNGKFRHKKTFENPMEISLSYDGTADSKSKDSRRLLAMQGRISLVHTDSLKRAVLKGPPAVMDYERLKEQTDPIVDYLVSLRLKAQQLMKNGGTIPPQLDSDYKGKVDELRGRYKSFVQSNPGSIVSLFAIKKLDGTNYSDPEIFDLYKGLTAAVKQSSDGVDIQQRFTIGLKTSVGTVLEDFSSLDTARNALGLAAVKAKGKLTLVDFWASWCKPCRAENPHLVKVYNEFHAKGFNILAVSLDRSEAAWKNAIQQDGLPWYHVSSLQYWDEPVVKQFGINGVPDSFLLDSDGRIIGRGLRGDKLYEAVKAALTL